MIRRGRLTINAICQTLQVTDAWKNIANNWRVAKHRK